MSSDLIDFDATSEENDPNTQADVGIGINRIASLNSRAVMPDGRALNRGEILQTLGLNPNTSPTAWLAIVACGSNASALRPGDLQRIAVNRLGNAAAVLKRVQGLEGSQALGEGGGYVSGGGAPKAG